MKITKSTTVHPKPEMLIKNVPIDQINFAPYNPRKELRPQDSEWHQIRSSIQKYGMVQNLIWNKRSGNLVAGHQRTRVATREFGWRVFPCIVVDLDDADEKALNIIMNKVGAVWDASKLTEILSELRASNAINLEDLGFKPVELEELLKERKPKTLRAPDAEAPAIPKVPRTKDHDLYRLIGADGETEHFLLCGDSTCHQAVERVMAGSRARMVFTDPPYGVTYVSAAKTDQIKKKDVTNDDLRGEQLQEFLKKAFGAMATGCIDDPGAYIFYASRCHEQFRKALELSGWEERQQLIWVKQMVLGRSDYHWSHEPMFYCARTGRRKEWFGTRCEKTFFDSTAAEIEALSREQAVDLLLEFRTGCDTWDIARDAPSTYVHPCLPTGEKVWIIVGDDEGKKDPAIGQWKSIETVNVGDYTSYGRVEGVSSHLASEIVGISTQGQCRGEVETVTATRNHPFLILRKGIVYWMEAQFINSGDATLSLRQTCPSGNIHVGLFFCLEHLNTPLTPSGRTPIGGFQDVVRQPKKKGYVGIMQDNATAMVIRTVHSVKFHQGATTVWNLNVQGMAPAFDTRIGISHNTQKPTQLARRAMRNSSMMREHVLDPFAGSGSTAVAGELQCRNTHSIEIDPGLCDVIIKRMTETFEDIFVEKNGKKERIKK